MGRHHVLPSALAAVAAFAIAVAFVLGGGGTPVASAPAAIAGPVSTTTTVATTTTTTEAPVDAAAIGALLGGLDAVWARTPAPASSCLVVGAGSRVLYERNPDVAVMPASAMKLVTAAAALDVLDPRERLVTSVRTGAPPRDGVVEGDLVLVGGGDPVLGTLDWAGHFARQPQPFTSIEALADRVVAAGVREVRGRVVGDDTRYDAERYVASWPARYRNANETGPLGALFVNDGFAVWASRDENSVPWDDPPRDAAGLLTTLLRERGVAVAGDASAGVAAPGSLEVASIESPTIAELVGAMLRESDNGTAELVLKEIGLRMFGTGTTAAGVHAVRESLARQGLPVGGIDVRDGSGLDRGNAVTCRLLAAILTGETGAIASGLPVAGQTGTLADRFHGTPIAGRLRAKTGSIRGVASLAGFASGQSELTFAHVLNGFGTDADARALQHALAAALVGIP